MATRRSKPATPDFNNKPIAISGVKGINDDLPIPLLNGHCTTCHDTPASGNHSIPAPLDIGLTDASRRTPDMWPDGSASAHFVTARLPAAEPGI